VLWLVWRMCKAHGKALLTVLMDRDSKLRIVHETFLCANESPMQQREWWNKHVEMTMV
jgi:hypothetical protein